MANEIIDLTNIDPEPVTIKINIAGAPQQIEINSPTTQQVFRLSSLGQKLAHADEMTSEELASLIDKFEAELKSVIPEIQNEQLSQHVLMKLSEIVVQMAAPKDAEELKKRKVEPTNPKVAEK